MEASPAVNRPRPKLTRRSVLLLASILLAGVAMWASQPHSALDTATVIVSSTDGGKSIAYSPDGWAPPSTMLGFSDIGEKSWEAHLHHIVTGKTETLDALKRLVRHFHTYQPAWVNWSISPDGRWLLWGDCHPSAQRGFFVAAVDGSQSFEWRPIPPVRDYDIVWRANSKAWFILERSRGRPVYLKTIHTYPLASPSRGSVRDVTARQLEPYLIGALSDGRIVTANNQQSQLTVFDPMNPELSAMRIDPQPPMQADGQTVSVSPDGKRLAWCVVSYLSTSSPGGWLHSITDGTNTIVDLFVTDLAGNEKRYLGRFRARQSSEGGDHFGIYGWAPDAKHLLFSRGDESETKIVKITIPER